jgi:hypothetical protein
LKSQIQKLCQKMPRRPLELLRFLKVRLYLIWSPCKASLQLQRIRGWDDSLVNGLGESFRGNLLSVCGRPMGVSAPPLFFKNLGNDLGSRFVQGPRVSPPSSSPIPSTSLVYEVGGGVGGNPRYFRRPKKRRIL